tara:strand:- start:1778 stop:2287 length:510 start_codon:yes stop_codon:yes gene_type:complete
MGNNLSDKVYHTFAGKIARTSQYGIQLMQHVDSERWLNYGKFFEGDKLEGDDVGHEFTINVQETPAGAYYIKNMATGLKGEDSIKPTDIPAKNEIKSNGQVSPKQTKGDDDRTQYLIIRQNSISNACTLLQNQKEIDADQVINLASMFEKWVLRKEDDVPSIDLDDIPF